MLPSLYLIHRKIMTSSGRNIPQRARNDHLISTYLKKFFKQHRYATCQTFSKYSCNDTEIPNHSCYIFYVYLSQKIYSLNYLYIYIFYLFTDTSFVPSDSFGVFIFTFLINLSLTNNSAINISLAIN